MTQTEIIISIIGALGGAKILEMLINYFINRKKNNVDIQKEENDLFAQRVNNMFNLMERQMDTLSEQLITKDNIIKDFDSKLEELKNRIDKLEEELSTAQRFVCYSMSCADRVRINGN